MIQLLSAIFGLAISNTPIAAHASQVMTPVEPATSLEVSIEGWEARKHDRFVVDTKENIGYLVHEDGHYAKFLVATGRNEVVRYIGLTYKATTPTKVWTVESKHTKKDRITFGKNGRFLRLYDKGTGTNYGIHDYAYLDDILKGTTEERFFSMGCVLVKPEILQVMEAIYDLNGGTLDVATVYGLDKALLIAQK